MGIIKNLHHSIKMLLHINRALLKSQGETERVPDFAQQIQRETE
jgi:hypothetical protein